MRIRGLALALLTVLASSSPALAAVIGFDSRAAWLGSVGGPTTLIDFESFADGEQITADLAPLGIALVSGTTSPLVGGGAVDVFVTSSGSLPFPMFTAGQLPSEDKFISNDLSSPGFATGSMTFQMAGATFAIGAFVADSAPLGGFTIEIFNGGGSLGSISVGPRTLPASFVGIVSTESFTRAVFTADNEGDSWGLDDVEFSRSPGEAPAPGTLALLVLGLSGIARARRRRP